MENFSIPWKTIKDSWNSSLLKNIKILARWNYEIVWKMAEGSEIKQWTHSLLNKILDKNEKCVLKTEATFWPTQYGSKLSKWGFNSMWTENFQMFKLDLQNAEEPKIKLPTSPRSQKKQESPEKHLYLLYWLCQNLWLCGSQQTVENSERDGNTRPPYLPPEKPVCRSGSNS